VDTQTEPAWLLDVFVRVLAVAASMTVRTVYQPQFRPPEPSYQPWCVPFVFREILPVLVWLARKKSKDKALLWLQLVLSAAPVLSQSLHVLLQKSSLSKY
jgi:tryptophan-rich sensory protein